MVTKDFEAIVIGSGATGGVAALTLAEAGIKVLVIEAGPNYSSQKAIGSEPCNSFRRISSLLTGEHGQQLQHPGFWKANPLLFAKKKDNPYLFPPSHPYIWTQGRQVGGRSLTWGGITLRLSNQNFTSAEVDGFGPNWPIKHEDLDKHYSALEKLFKIHGMRDGLQNLPDGEYISPLPLTSSEKSFASKIQNDLGYKLINSRGFGPHQPSKKEPWPKFSSPGSTLRKAIATGNVEVLCNHIVEKLIMNNEKDKAKGVLLINILTNSRIEIKGKLIIMCGSTIQTLKILLNSEETNHSNGFVDPSGMLGENLMDHISTCRFFAVPKTNADHTNNVDSNYTLSGAGSFLIPCGDKIQNNNSKKFIRDYGIWGGIDRFNIPSFLRKIPETTIGFLIGHGEVLPQKKNKVTLSNELDKWETPIPFIDCCWGENELLMVSDIQKTINLMITSAGGKILPLHELINLPFLEPILSGAMALQEGAPPPGYYIHEVGGAPMGREENSSVVDPINRLWRCSNVLVVDGACWPSSGWQSPTLTMMAITRRACLEAIKPRNA
ncbi:GMC family oxidoreductase [Prochlorococcus sp. MIT 1341]|uniref:GMC family oxidoreductase n=1 Tax=Prochlorococcus sp. MIT 1341 TaxID=3096221 RepID=UPI002A75E19E|nr:GMC family oxidoreductase [Prochlorococcus sp. MIT 1341]